MASHIVIYIRSNPKESHRACEGIRIALGLAACNLNVELILTNGAAILLTDDIDECVDGELAKQYLPSLIKFIPMLYVEKRGGGVVHFNKEYVITFLNPDEIAKKIASAECIARF
jgi:hypothetical protein